jgi:hypothetical protein
MALNLIRKSFSETPAYSTGWDGADFTSGAKTIGAFSSSINVDLGGDFCLEII